MFWCLRYFVTGFVSSFSIFEYLLEKLCVCSKNVQDFQIFSYLIKLFPTVFEDVEMCQFQVLMKYFGYALLTLSTIYETISICFYFCNSLVLAAISFTDSFVKNQTLELADSKI